MLERKYVVFYANSSGISETIAERDIVLTYVLQIMANNVLPQLAFKGGTCLKKIYVGKTGRFSMDLDFTAAGIGLDELQNELKRLLHKKSALGLNFEIIEDNVTDESYLAVVEYSHAWNLESQFQLQVSYREKPLMPLSKLPLSDEMYLKYCEFKNFPITCMHREEVLAEKIRASFERVRSRDLYDLYLFTKLHYDRDMVRKLSVIKCWNAKDPFDPRALFGKISNENYNWEDLQKLVRKKQLPSSGSLIKAVLKEYSYLENLEQQLLTVVKDSKAHKEQKLVAEILSKIYSLKTAQDSSSPRQVPASHGKTNGHRPTRTRSEDRKLT